jgi:hypothetical protein
MANGYQHEVLDEAGYDEAGYDEGWGEPEAYEPEARGRGRGRPSPAAPRGGYAPQPQATGQFVNQAQFEKALNAVREDMQKNARAITAAGAQVDALSTRVRRDIGRAREEAKSTTQMLALLPLLSQKTLTTGADVNGADGTTKVIPKDTKLAVAQDGIGAMLPLLLISGGLGGTSSGQGGQDNNNMMMLVLLMTMLNK